MYSNRLRSLLSPITLRYNTLRTDEHSRIHCGERRKKKERSRDRSDRLQNSIAQAPVQSKVRRTLASTLVSFSYNAETTSCSIHSSVPAVRFSSMLISNADSTPPYAREIPVSISSTRPSHRLTIFSNVGVCPITILLTPNSSHASFESRQTSSSSPSALVRSHIGPRSLQKSRCKAVHLDRSVGPGAGSSIAMNEDPIALIRSIGELGPIGKLSM